MSAAKDLYSILGVKKSASDKEIQQAYRKLARKYHPDVNKNNAKAEQRFKEVSAAYDVLSDNKKKRLYDEFGLQGLQAGFNEEQARMYKQYTEGMGASSSSRGRTHFDQAGGATGFEDLGAFSDLFGDLFSGFSAAGGSRRASAKPKPAVHEQALPVSFRDAILGGRVEIVLGSGSLRKNLKVKIPAGSKEGSKIRLSGQKTGMGSDVVLVLKVQTHPYFSRKGNNLLLDLPVKISELLLGAKVQVPTLNGKVNLNIPAGSKAGAVLRLKGKGVASSKHSAGDLLVKLMLVAPDKVSEGSKKLASEMDSYYSKDPRRELFS